MCDKFSSTCKHDLYLYPLLFPDMYDLYPIHEGGDCGVKTFIDSSDDYIRSEQCSDEYKLSGDEKPLWQTIDEWTCKGASVSQAFAVKWMPLSHPLPLGCPLKDVSAIAIKEGERLLVDLYSAYQIHMYVDGGFAPAGSDDLASSAESCNATWAFAVIAVNELMQGK